VVTEHDIYKSIGIINMYTESELLKVKVPMVFLGTVGFSLRRDMTTLFEGGGSV
jgi:hypothetical protein